MPERAAELSRSSVEALLALQPAYLPMVLFTAWWDAALDIWCPPCRMQADHRRSDLPVPETIQRTGEHALFA